MIRKATFSDVRAIADIARKAVSEMQARGINQWTSEYPDATHFRQDVDAERLFVYEDENGLAGGMAFMEENDPPYRDIEWLRDKSMVIHRIVVDPARHRHGIAAALIRHAVKYCEAHGYESIKIDTHPGNMRMRRFLKKHQFAELAYIPSMHRIGFERLIERHAMKRIVIFGSSGTGKTTLSRLLSEKFGMSFLHLDTVYWKRNWTSMAKPEFDRKVREYMRKNLRFVIDGNYANSENFFDRLHLADTIILLDYSRNEAIKGICEREEKYKHRYRSDMATGCIEGIDQEFLHYVYRFDKKKHMLSAIMNHYSGRKHLLKFKDRDSLNEWLSHL